MMLCFLSFWAFIRFSNSSFLKWLQLTSVFIARFQCGLCRVLFSEEFVMLPRSTLRLTESTCSWVRKREEIQENLEAKTERKRFGARDLVTLPLAGLNILLLSRFFLLLLFTSWRTRSKGVDCWVKKLLIGNYLLCV